MTNREQFPDLYDTLSVMFYQLWDDFYQSIEETVRDNWQSLTPSEKEVVKKQLACFIEIIRSSDTPKEMLLEMGCYYNSTWDGTTVVEFLEKLDKLLV